MNSYIIFLTFYLLLSKTQTQFNLYYTHYANDTNWYYDCLYYKALDPIVKLNVKTDYRIPYQIIQYCIRPTESQNKDHKTLINGSILSVFTFGELSKQNISTSDLLSWSAPVDLIERYEQYIATLNSSLESEEFYNCTSSWFGSFCQYTFNLDATFDNIVKQTFEAKYTKDCDLRLILPRITNMTCYEHLKCNRGPTPMCLDWHEICDGQIHCIGSGVDETNCFELEKNECENDQYRCHNGMCIPEQFLNDDPVYPDCLDVSDEHFYSKAVDQCKDLHECLVDPTFRCEDVNYPIDFLLTQRRSRPSKQHGFNTQNKEEFLAMLHTFDNRRHITFDHSILLNQEHTNLTYECWLLMSCLTFGRFTDMCDTVCSTRFCYLRIQSRCNTTAYVIFPTMPVFHGHVLFGYWTETIVPYHNIIDRPMIKPDFLCYDVQRCPFFPYHFKIDNYTCIDNRTIDLSDWDYIRGYFYRCLTIDQSGNETHCIHSSLFHCPGTSKCISKHRLVDGISDCFEKTDETYNDSCKLNHKHRFRCSSENKCISPILVQDRVGNCYGKEDETVPMYNKLFYENLCNGYTHNLPILVNGQNETDETNCEQWPCNNLYTRCDGAWTCLNGADELNCNPLSKCYPDYHECISPTTFDIICLPLNQSNDGKMDCLGGTDERGYCRNLYPGFFFSNYHCWNETKCHISDCAGPRACFFEKDTGFEQVCNTNQSIKAIVKSLDIDGHLIRPPTHPADSYSFPRYKYFTLHSSDYFPLKPTHTSLTQMDKIFYQSDEHVLKKNTQLSVIQYGSEVLNKIIDFRRAWICNRGVLVYVGTELAEHCLCPPSYYGDRCQFQSQRVSLTVKFRKECTLNCHGVYGIVLTLIDQNHTTYSYEQLTYIPTNNCTMKYNLYFLYGPHSKDMTKNYTVDIHAYNKADLTYYTSWTLPVQFPFLPVNRMAAFLIIPPYTMDIFDNCTLECGNHGHCAVYTNNKKQFCRCDPGWTGLQCTIENINCDCSSDSLCIGIVNDRSICLCPLHKTGPRCYVRPMCQHDSCKNGGQCISKEDPESLSALKCMCAPGFRGTTCEFKDAQIELSFHDVEIPQSVLLYLIAVQVDNDPVIIMSSKKIRLDQYKTILFTALLSNLIFARIHDEYYLLYKEVKAKYSPFLAIEIKSSQQCLPIDTFLDKRTVAFPLLRRAKYYHVICKNHRQLTCLYDKEAFLCLCNNDRFANCFYFNFTEELSCQGQNHCENDGKCFQDDPYCPTSTMCACNECYFGGQCQFTTKGSVLSLDTILGYQIRQHLSVSHQSTPVKVSIGITSLMLFIGLVSGILSAMTFSSKNVREVGCGLYLFASSILSIITTIILTVKIWLLIITQSLWVTNHIILLINCNSIEFILRCLPAIGDWLTACVAIERTFVIINGVNFNKKRSKEIAPWIIVGVIIFCFASGIQDPIHRKLIHDKEEERTWCIARYSLKLQIYDSTIHLVHFIIPFSINLISAILIIILEARTHSNARKKQPYKQYLREQFREHKHLIISPCALVIIGVPRLIISFLSGCMKSLRNPWLFLFGYFISFLPTLLIPLLYLLPSKTYTKELQIVVRRCLHRN
ncbi:unnamed protein product [Adineta steineri]|uniref:Uncharacterized protein n=1 Tax=Adineta steineri TaxID=433720 RepID=A0A814JH67_9BILA|nr:unnamed protein product [Adineta steineri]CAF1035823.1 unnamed protein product [Adineta steineri]CAF1111014.1 unnamed protein product [Adineta steineri]